MNLQPPLPFFEPKTNWTPPPPNSWPRWSGARRICVDVETKDLNLRLLGPGVRTDGYIVGIALAIEDGPKLYFPIRHAGGGNLDANQVLNYFRQEAASFEGEVVGMHLDYDLDFLAEERIVFPKAKAFYDVEIASALINELELSYSLDAIAAREGLPGKDETLLREALASYGYKGRDYKAGIWALPAGLVGPYGEQDAALPLQILTRQERKIEEQELERVWELESAVLPIVTEMRRHGVRIDPEHLERVEVWRREKQTEAMNEVSRITGVRLSVDDATQPQALAQALRAIGIEPPKTKTGKPTVNKDFLASISGDVGKHIATARKFSTLQSLFIDSIKRHAVRHGDDWRIHCTFNQLRRTEDENDDDPDTKGAAYGRLSAEHPNMQQQPARDKEIGPFWRKLYLPDRGGFWGSHDYSQQEPRLAVHYAVECGPEYIGQIAYSAAAEAARQFHEDPSKDFHQMMADMAHIERKPAKEIFLGLSYGMGGPKLCRKLGLPTKVIERKGRWIEVAGDEGQALIDTFNTKVPFVRATSFVAQERAKRYGYITTFTGRRCRFPKDENGNFDWTQKAFNRLIQGASACQTKTALVAITRAGYRPQLQVHDELDRTHQDERSVREVNEIMETCVKLHVPSKVDCETGPSWGEAK